MLDHLKPIESLGEVQLLFKYDQLLQLARLVHAKNALDCLRRGDLPGGADQFEKLSQASVDLRRAAELREEILNPENDFAALRSHRSQAGRKETSCCIAKGLNKGWSEPLPVVLRKLSVER